MNGVKTEFITDNYGYNLSSLGLTNGDKIRVEAWTHRNGMEIARSNTLTYGSAHTHKYTKTGTAATCETVGKFTYTCSCGHTYTENEAALGHTWEYDGGKNPATCTVCGETCDHPNPTYGDFYSVDSQYHDFDIICPICGCGDTGSNINGIKYPHNFVNGVCSVCGYSKE